MDYARANGMLTGRCAHSRKVGNNTYLLRRGADSIAVRLHDTDVITFKSDGSIRLACGGYHTRTTADRMNEFLPGGYRVHGEPFETRRVDSGALVLVSYTNGREHKQEVLIDDAADISAAGELQGGDVSEYREERKRERNERNRPRARARYWNSRPAGSYRGTAQSILEETNASVRLAKMKAYGMDRFFLDAKTEVLHELAGYQLIQLRLDSWNIMRALKMACSTTGAVYVNTVPSHIETVPLALDWMFNTHDYLGQITQQT